MVVVAVAGTSSAQFGQLVTQLKLEQGVAVSDQTNLEDVDFRFLVADIDTCQALGLAQNSLVETIVLNAAVQLDSGAPFDGSKAVNQTEDRSDRRSELLSDGRVMSGSSRQEKRQIPTEFHGFTEAQGLTSNGKYLAGSPFHLDWLTAPGANRGLREETCMCIRPHQGGSHVSC